MFGDDPDPSEAIVRVGFRGKFRTRARGGLRGVDKDKVSDKRPRRRQERKRGATLQVWLVSKWSTKARGELGNYERTTSLRKHADAMRMMR